MKFSDLGLRAPLLKAIEDKGYTTPSPIQVQAIPPILKGHDLIAAAQTGTGKTAGFTLPILQRLDGGTRVQAKCVRALILTPTRELAAQVQQSIEDYGKHLSLSSLVVFGGVSIQPQINRIRRGVDLLVATPGRLLDLHQQGAVDLSQVEVLILDEADRMLDMGFVNDMRKLAKLVPKDRQTLLFSATFSREIRQLSQEFLKNPVSVEVARENTAAETVTQSAYRCDPERKGDLTLELITQGKWTQVLIFTRTKHGANRLSEKLSKAGISSNAIHGNKSQGARTKALEGFKSGKVRVLVATDIAARGIDIAQLPQVINYELPNVAEDYVHRIGRTGRAGMSGQAISLVANEERPFFDSIQKLISQKIPLLDSPGFEPKDWPDRAPTAKEVMQLQESRKRDARQGRMRSPSHSPSSPRDGMRRHNDAMTPKPRRANSIRRRSGR